MEYSGKHVVFFSNIIALNKNCAVHKWYHSHKRNGPLFSYNDHVWVDHVLNIHIVFNNM